MSEHPFNRVSAFVPIYMSIGALLAVALSVHHATHEDATWHIWMLMLFLQLPLVVYFAITSRRGFRKVAPIVLAQGVLWVLALLAGGFQPGWA
jgi:hypothetical protein